MDVTTVQCVKVLRQRRQSGGMLYQ
jgi:hypothetical protein